YCYPSPSRPAVRSRDRVPMGRERNTDHLSDIRAQTVAMIPCVPSQDLCLLKTLSARHSTQTSSFQNADQKQDRNLDSLPAPSGVPTALENPSAQMRLPEHDQVVETFDPDR